MFNICFGRVLMKKKTMGKLRFHIVGLLVPSMYHMKNYDCVFYRMYCYLKIIEV